MENIRRVRKEERSGKIVGGPFPRNMFLSKSNKNIIFGGHPVNGSFGVLCTFFALQMHRLQLCSRSGYGKIQKKA